MEISKCETADNSDVYLYIIYIYIIYLCLSWRSGKWKKPPARNFKSCHKNPEISSKKEIIWSWKFNGFLVFLLELWYEKLDYSILENCVIQSEISKREAACTLVYICFELRKTWKGRHLPRNFISTCHKNPETGSKMEIMCFWFWFGNFGQKS